MKGPALAVILIAIPSLAASWMLGYHEGQQTGAFRLLRQMDQSFILDVRNAEDIDRDQVCNEIRRYKLSIAKDLDENTEICGYSDMDGSDNSPGNSN